MTKLRKFSDYLKVNFLGGPHIVPMNYIINFFKGATPGFILFLMYKY